MAIDNTTLTEFVNMTTVGSPTSQLIPGMPSIDLTSVVLAVVGVVVMLFGVVMWKRGQRKTRV